MSNVLKFDRQFCQRYQCSTIAGGAEEDDGAKGGFGALVARLLTQSSTAHYSTVANGPNDGYDKFREFC